MLRPAAANRVTLSSAAQYYSDATDPAGHPVVSMWIPLQPAREADGTCMQLAPCGSDGPLREGWHDPETGFLGIEPSLQPAAGGVVSAEMRPGDLLCFHQLVPHRALPNGSSRVRWALDVRYEAADGATASGKKMGFLARSSSISSRTGPAAVPSCAQWLASWKDIPPGSY
jgi:ectoine hydroxylase-related dioxygenase (phytanoyl-CoA dioxygenase family)